jgi:alanine dehydrogenase
MTSQKQEAASDMQSTLATQPQPEMMPNPASNIHIGLVGNYADTDETRLLLTPEACGMLTSYGIRISMESGAGVDISFTDETFAEYGVEIVTREEALKCNTVLSFQSLRAKDIKKMTKGASLLCTMGNTLFEESTIKALISQHIACGCLDNVISHHDVPIFADILDEIDGRAAIMYAQESLSYLGGGKGVLLAGLAGLTPCEVLVIGTGTKAVAAANAAAAAGARVVLMDNDASSLQLAAPNCDSRVERILIHPRVLTNLVKSADVIIMATTTRSFSFPKSLSSSLKDSIYVLDLNETHPSISVPRTVAMAISNPMYNFIEEMAINNGLKGMLITSPGVQSGMVTYEGKLVDKLIGSCIGMPSIDIRVMISSSN